MELFNTVQSVHDIISTYKKQYVVITLYKSVINNRWVIHFEGKYVNNSIYIYKAVAKELLKNKYFIISVHSINNDIEYNYNPIKLRREKIRVLQY
jgi:hypothetical protein